MCLSNVSNMNNNFKSDYYRMTGKRWSLISCFDLLYRYELRYLWSIRLDNKFLKTLVSLRMGRKYGLEILSSNIGPGLYLGHPHGINVHPDATIGKNCNLNKGCTVGRENRGKRKGVPRIGDEVWIGSNAMVCGNITIGNNVLIAPNAYVNIDVPSNSIVIGNPCKISYSEQATEAYINFKIK